MPGPGGGSHGGGFSGGGSRGGGGGFGGGPRGGGPRGGGFGPRPGPHFWGPRFYGPRFGGCLGGLFGMIMVPVVLLLVLVLLFFGTIADSFRAIGTGGVIAYNEETFQDYANTRYREVFGSSSAYEDNLLVVFLTDEDNSRYYYIAWVGDHIATDINYMFGGEHTALGLAVQSAVNTKNYKYSLDSNLASVMDVMARNVTNLKLTSSFTCQEEHAQVPSHLVNLSTLELTESTVNDALTRFTDATGIPAVIVVDEAEDVFPRSYADVIWGFVILAGIILIAVLSIRQIVKAVRARKEGNDGDGWNNGNSNGNNSNGW